MGKINLVIAEYKHTPEQYKIWTGSGFICEMNHAYSKNMKSLKYAVDFCNRKMGRKFYTIVNNVSDLKQVKEQIQENKKLIENLKKL